VIIADTGFFLALANARDQHHEADGEAAQHASAMSEANVDRA